MKESNLDKQSDRIQELAERFVYNNDDSVFFECINSMEKGIKAYIKEFLKSKNVPRINSFLDDIYDSTIDSIYDNARDYYNKDKGRFTTWVYFVTKRNCINAIRPYVANAFYVVSPDLNDIESKNLEEDPSAGRYRVNQVEDERRFVYEINGESKVSTYKEMVDDVVACIYSCIYSMKCATNTDRRRKEMLRMLYIEKKTMQEVSDEMGCKICNVKNAVTVKRGEILDIFKVRYSELYDMMVAEKLFEGKL